MKLICSIKARAERAGLTGGDFFAALAAAFVVASVVYALQNDFTVIALAQMYPLWISVSITLGGFVLLAALSILLLTKRIIAWTLLLSSLTLCVTLVAAFPDNIFFCIGLAAVLVLVAKYVCEEDKTGLLSRSISKRASFIICAILVVVFTILVYSLTAAKYKSFYHSAFDFGIFCQMFESMATTGLPYTTVERSQYLSHFAVHFSPFFYVLLPFYFLWRSPLFLLFAQALGIGLGAFAVRRICLSLGLSEGMSLAGAAVYLLFPTMANGCFYDFHENKFLAVLILWAVAFALEKKLIGCGIFCFLILTVKEDAFIYVIAICLWMFVTKRNRLFAIIVALLSFAWFFFACNMIELSGGEIMTGRFSNYTHGKEGGLLEAVRTCFTDIGFLFKEVFAGADTDAFYEMTYTGQKLEFVLWTAAPLLFTPFLRKRPSELVLLIPLLVINLMPRWMYQFDVDFQYTYGTAALMIVSSLLFIGESSKQMRRFVVVSALCASLVFSCALILPKAKRYTDSYGQNKEAYDMTAEALKDIPADASVTAYGYFVPHLWYVKDLHTCPEYYAPYEKTDYYIVDTRYDYDSHTAKMLDAMGDSYELIAEEGYAQIYRIKD